jgi:hypothetical protein
MSAHGTYERAADRRLRYVPPAGSRGIDRVPGRLRDLTPTVDAVDVRPCESSASGPALLVRRIDWQAVPEWHPKVGIIRTARAVYRAKARALAAALKAEKAATA